MKNKLAILLAICLLSSNLANTQNQWVSQTSGTSAFLTSVYFVSADTGWVCSQAGNISKTINGGTTWSSLGMGPGGALFFLNAQKGFGAGEECLLKTSNGGLSWDTAYKNPEVYWVMGLSFPSPTMGYAAALDQGMGSYVLKSSNSGISWDTVYHNPDDMFQSIFFVNAQKGFIGGFQGYLYKTENGGTTWLAIDINSSAGLAIASIYFPTPDTGYIATDIGGVYRTTDGGNTWNHLSMSFPPALYSVWFTDANHGFVGGGDGSGSMTLYKTSNAGNSWSQSASGVNTINAMYFVGALPGYAVGENGTILKYTNTSGADEIMVDENNVEIYPNPASDYIIIVSDVNLFVEIFDYSGKKLKSFFSVSKETELDIKDLIRGIYFIKSTGEKCVMVKKFVKE